MKGTYEESEEDDGKKHIVCLNLSCPKYTGEGVCPHEMKTDQLKGVSQKEAANDLVAIQERKAEVKSNASTTESSSESDIDENFSTSAKKRKQSQSDADDERSTAKRKSDVKSEPRLELRADSADAEELLAVAEEQLKKLDEKLVKLLAWQRLQQARAFFYYLFDS